MRELGIESKRERAAASALPPLSFLHVWWSRKPLVSAAAVVAAGLLPAWSEKLAHQFPGHKELVSELAYHSWLLRLTGVWGDPIAAKSASEQAKAAGTPLKHNPFTYKQAFRNSVGAANIALLQEVVSVTWGEMPIVADITAGGGSIPYVASRLGFEVLANDLNPISAAILRGSVKIPAEFGSGLLSHLKTWGGQLVDRLVERTLKFFPPAGAEVPTNYLYVNAVRCPRTERWSPLTTKVWLNSESGKETAVEFVTTDENGAELGEPSFAIVTGIKAQVAAEKGTTVARGVGISIYDRLSISAEYIKQEAQAGRMRQILYAVATKTVVDGKTKRGFRLPTETDLKALRAAEEQLAAVRKDWEARGVIPTEDIYDGAKTREPLNKGMTSWADMFTPRQLLVHGTFVEEFQRIIPEVRAALDTEMADAVLFELGLLIGKAINYNSRLTSWHVVRQVMRSVFDEHNFAFKWDFAEFEGANELYPWCLTQLIDSYKGISELLENTGRDSLDQQKLTRPVTVLNESATDLRSVKDGSIAHLCIDPPYHDNLMYGELADYFYVWEKHTIGHLTPDGFASEFCDKDNEAVANPSRFAMHGKKKKKLANLDYEGKMASIFSECHRILRDDGVLTVMFTHKKADAWDGLGMALIQAGFVIETSWPVNTESEQSLHQAKKAAASSTIMLVCRKRELPVSADKTYLDDVAGEIRTVVRDSVTAFESYGIFGVDLLLSTYGPALSVVSKSWPVYSPIPDAAGDPLLLRPDQALDIARQEVSRLRKARLIGRETRFDAYTDFALLAWDTFKARTFPFDDARKLALSIGDLDVDQLIRAKILSKSSSNVSFVLPSSRASQVSIRQPSLSFGVSENAGSFEHLIDALRDLIFIARVDGLAAAKSFADAHQLLERADFLDLYQGMINAVPRVKNKGKWELEEAGVLDDFAQAYLPNMDRPEEMVVAVPMRDPQENLFDIDDDTDGIDVMDDGFDIEDGDDDEFDE